MKKINFCTGMLLLSLSSFAGGNNIVKTDNQVKKAEKEKEEKLEYVCCTRTTTLFASDLNGNLIMVSRTQEACVNNGESVEATMPIACEAAQRASYGLASEALSLALRMP
jgi:hypothetical protein